MVRDILTFSNYTYLHPRDRPMVIDYSNILQLDIAMFQRLSYGVWHPYILQLDIFTS